MIMKIKDWIKTKLNIQTEYISWNELMSQDLFNEKNEFYGKGKRIARSTILIIITIACFITVGTNWLILIAAKKIKTDFVIRW